MGLAALECLRVGRTFFAGRKPHPADAFKTALITRTMKISPRSKLVFAAALGLAFSVIAAHAQLNINLRSQATFGPFVGARAFIMAGVTVGAGCIIGAMSVVTHDVPPGAIVAGNPARILGQRPVR